MKNTTYLTRIQEGFIEGVCVVKISGRLTSGKEKSSLTFKKYFEEQISNGLRYFVFDFSDLQSVDSSGLSELVGALARARARAGKIVLLKCSASVQEFFTVTRFYSLMESANDLSAALSMFQVQVSKVPPSVRYVEKYSVEEVEDNGEKKLIVNDNISEEPHRTEYKVRDIPAEEGPKTFNPKLLVLVVLTSVITMGLTIYGLIWAAKATSSIVLLALIFTLALLFFIVLSALVLRLSGHLSEQAAAKLFGGVLSKLPGLGVWLHSKSAKKGSAD